MIKPFHGPILPSGVLTVSLYSWAVLLKCVPGTFLETVICMSTFRTPKHRPCIRLKLSCFAYSTRISQTNCLRCFFTIIVPFYQGCARLMSHESNLTRLWLKWVESSWVSRKKSKSWVESESSHADGHLSQSWLHWILFKFESLILPKWENANILTQPEALNVTSATFDSTPPPVSNFWRN